MMFNQKGAVPLLILAAIVGLIIFLAFAELLPFKDKTLQTLYPKHDSHAASNLDLTSNVEILGNPTSEQWSIGGGCDYARNIWDMTRYNGRIYFGSGNSANGGPCANAGPVNIWYFDSSSSSFNKDTSVGTWCGTTCVDEEQINVIRLLNNELYIPGHDPRDGWDLGNFYRLEANGWVKYRTLLKGVHTYDMYYFQNQLFASLGPDVGVANMQLSSDRGSSWINTSSITNVRMFSLFELNGILYGAGENYIKQYNGGTSVSNVNSNGMFPSSPNVTKRVERPVNYLNQLIYIGGYTVNDHQYIPFGLYKASQFNRASLINLPDNALAHDIIVGEDNVCYVLGSIKVDNNHYIVTVYRSTDLNNWSEVFRFNADTFARSFEMLNGDFYFGLGAETDVIPTSVGSILRVKKTFFSDVQPSATPSPTPSPTANPTISPTPAPTPTASPTPSPTPTPPPTPSPTPQTKVGDLNNDNEVNSLDFAILLSKWNTSDSTADLNHDGIVGLVDFSILLSKWGT